MLLEITKANKKIAKKNYKIWKKNPFYKGFEFKQVHQKKPIYSIRVGIGWMALGIIVAKDKIVWFWIGSHNDYDKLLNK